MQTQTHRYKRITYLERDIIARYLAQGYSKRSIARELNRSASTITRETKRDTKNTDGYGYGAGRAGRRSMRRASGRRRGKYKLERIIDLYRYVMKKLKQLWSPQQIESRLKDEYPEDKSMRISSESIYRYLYVKPSRELRMLLRHRHLRRRKRGRPKKDEKRGKILDMTMIEQRPVEVRKRLVPGHWEGDLLKGKRNQSVIGTLVERSTRYVVLVSLGGLDAHSVRVKHLLMQ
jgi:transposase, IS30 family